MTGTTISQPLALQTFEIRPTPASLPASQRVDELMIDWGEVPAGSGASIYLPAVAADDVLALAARMYVTHRFSRVDSHTLACKAGGISYLPIPKGFVQNYAGLLAMTLPKAIERGRIYSVTVRQVTTAFGRTGKDDAADLAASRTLWRRVLGTFQVSLSVKAQHEALVATERLYGVLLWIQQAIAPADRWYPVFLRYLAQLAHLIASLGGKPERILPSPTGHVPSLPHPKPVPVKGKEAAEVTGKIEGIVYDHFGDFDGFILETETGEHHRFFSREEPMLDLVRTAWIDRTRITVFLERHDSRVPRSMVLRAG